MLINSKKMLLRAHKKGYAVPAFNVHNLETIKAVVLAAYELSSPVIISCTPSTFRYAGMENIVKICEGLSLIYNVPLVLHMDHHKDFNQIKKGLELGIKSIMIDGAALSYEENIEITRKVVHISRNYDATIEAELGVIPGVEDDLNINEEECKHNFSKLEIDKILNFIEVTGVDSLALAIGNAHGIYKAKPQLNIDKLAEVRHVSDIPLVLHGGSGLTATQIRRCISHGVSKVNIGTELKYPFVNALKKFFKENPKCVDPRLYFTPAINAMKELAKEKIKICMCDNTY